jgi:hypothetical protein
MKLLIFKIRKKDDFFNIKILIKKKKRNFRILKN